MPYAVFVDDNFRYQDPEGRSIGLVFDDPEDAISYCVGIVLEYLESAHKPGMTAADLYSSYTMFGEDPFIRAIDAEPLHFSAWNVAKVLCERICVSQSISVPENSPRATKAHSVSLRCSILLEHLR